MSSCSDRQTPNVARLPTAQWLALSMRLNAEPDSPYFALGRPGLPRRAGRPGPAFPAAFLAGALVAAFAGAFFAVFSSFFFVASYSFSSSFACVRFVFGSQVLSSSS